MTLHPGLRLHSLLDAVAESISNKLVPADVQNTMASGRLASYYFTKMVFQVVFSVFFATSKNMPYPLNSLSVLVVSGFVIIFGIHVWCNRHLDPKEILVSVFYAPQRSDSQHVAKIYSDCGRSF